MSRKKIDKLTQEELQKTQVLNLKDVQETVRYEKKTSKKPAFIMGLIGLLSISIGTTFTVMQKVSTTQKEPEKVEKRKTEVKKPVPSQVNCTFTEMAKEDGTDTTLNIQYEFMDNKLQQATKTYTVNVIEGNETGKTTLQDYITAYQNFMNNTDGYEITVTPTETNLVTVVKIDYTKLNMQSLAEIQNTHVSTSVPYTKNMEKTSVENDMKTKGYICQ